MAEIPATEDVVAKIPLTVRIEEELLGRLDEFCRLTTRDRQDVIREALNLLFKDGLRAADMRLRPGLSGPEFQAALDKFEEEVRAILRGEEKGGPGAGRRSRAAGGKKAV